MDQELTSKNFLRFITRRGLSRDRADAAAADRSTPEPSQSVKTPSPMEIDEIANRRSSLVYTRPGYSGADTHQHRPTRMSDTFGTNRNRHATRPVIPVSHHDSLQRLPSSSSHASTRPPPPTQPPSDRRYNRSSNDDQPNKKFYRCEYCGLSFGRKHHKERHVANIHRHEKPYVCNLCGHRFHQKPNLDRHRATVHADVSPFRCDHCGANFARRNLLKTHVQTMHEHSRRHECSICHAVLREAQELSEHMRLEHSSPVTQHSRSTR